MNWYLRSVGGFWQKSKNNVLLGLVLFAHLGIGFGKRFNHFFATFLKISNL
jgi:hypothetical protein